MLLDHTHTKNDWCTRYMEWNRKLLSGITWHILGPLKRLTVQLLVAWQKKTKTKTNKQNKKQNKKLRTSQDRAFYHQVDNIWTWANRFDRMNLNRPLRTNVTEIFGFQLLERRFFDTLFGLLLPLLLLYIDEMLWTK